MRWQVAAGAYQLVTVCAQGQVQVGTDKISMRRNYQLAAAGVINGLSNLTLACDRCKVLESSRGAVTAEQHLAIAHLVVIIVCALSVFILVKLLRCLYNPCFC